MPDAANGRGLAEAGVLPNAGPGLRRRATPPGATPPRSPPARAAGELTALYLLRVDPLRDLPGRARRGSAALERATTVIAHAGFLTEGIREHATVVFPAEAYAEKDGTITHPDGRLQRLRAAIGHPGAGARRVAVIAELCAPRSASTSACSPAPMATAPARRGRPVLRRADARRDRRPGACAGRRARPPRRFPRRRARAGRARGRRRTAARANGRLRLGTFRSIWARTEVAVSPALQFLHPRQRVELAPADAQRLGSARATASVVGSNGTRRATVDAARRRAAPARLPGGRVPEDAPTRSSGPLVEVRKA